MASCNEIGRSINKTYNHCIKNYEDMTTGRKAKTWAKVAGAGLVAGLGAAILLSIPLGGRAGLGLGLGAGLAVAGGTLIYCTYNYDIETYSADHGNKWERKIEKGGKSLWNGVKNVFKGLTPDEANDKREFLATQAQKRNELRKEREERKAKEARDKELDAKWVKNRKKDNGVRAKYSLEQKPITERPQ